MNDSMAQHGPWLVRTDAPGWRIGLGSAVRMVEANKFDGAGPAASLQQLGLIY